MSDNVGNWSLSLVCLVGLVGCTSSERQTLSETNLALSGQDAVMGAQAVTTTTADAGTVPVVSDVCPTPYAPSLDDAAEEALQQIENAEAGITGDPALFGAIAESDFDELCSSADPVPVPDVFSPEDGPDVADPCAESLEPYADQDDPYGDSADGYEGDPWPCPPDSTVEQVPVATDGGLLAVRPVKKRRKGVPLPTIEQQVITETNKRRAKRRLPLLTLDADAKKVARLHAYNMIKKQTLKHRLYGKRVGERMTAAGVRWRVVGENLAVGHANGVDVVAAWIKSRRHRRQIDTPGFRGIGVAAVRYQGTIWYVQVFVRRR